MGPWFSEDKDTWLWLLLACIGWIGEWPRASNSYYSCTEVNAIVKLKG